MLARRTTSRAVATTSTRTSHFRRVAAPSCPATFPATTPRSGVPSQRIDVVELLPGRVREQPLDVPRARGPVVVAVVAQIVVVTVAAVVARRLAVGREVALDEHRRAGRGLRLEVAGRVVVVSSVLDVVAGRGRRGAAEERRHGAVDARPGHVVGGGERRREGERAADARLGRRRARHVDDAPGAVLDADARRAAAPPAQQKPRAVVGVRERRGLEVGGARERGDGVDRERRVLRFVRVVGRGRRGLGRGRRVGAASIGSGAGAASTGAGAGVARGVAAGVAAAASSAARSRAISRSAAGKSWMAASTSVNASSSSADPPPSRNKRPGQSILWTFRWRVAIDR